MINNNSNNLEDEEELSENVLKVLNNLIFSKLRTTKYNIKKNFLSSCGENSYGSIIQLEITSDNNNNNKFYCILKLSPKNVARRKTMNVVNYYKREIFMYTNVLNYYKQLQIDLNLINYYKFNAIPELYCSSLNLNDEFLILEDLHQLNYSRFNRQKPLTFNHTALALNELAKFHAMSFILKHNNYKLFNQIIDEIRYDNLFTDAIEQISVEFGKKYIKKTIQFIKDDENNKFSFNHKNLIIEKLKNIYNNFKEICIELVNGKNAEEFAVICHGDFWNNNILYKYNTKTGIPESAKILDFQMARYASPILDFVHYLFSCTEKSLRDKHFIEFKDIYYKSLTDHLKLFQLNPLKIFPHHIFEEHLQKYGIYGFCMAVYAIPFFISDSCDLPDLDEVSEALHDITESSSSASSSSSSSSDDCNSSNSNCSVNDDQNSSDSDTEKCEKTNALLDVYEILNEKSIPIFRKRMIGIVQDLEKYQMF